MFKFNFSKICNCIYIYPITSNHISPKRPNHKTLIHRDTKKKEDPNSPKP